MARKMIVEVVVDYENYRRGLKRADEATNQFARRTEHSFRSVGRSLAFATGGFVAFHSAVDFLRQSIDAARDAAVSQRSLAAQMKASGQSFEANRARIEGVARSYARFGFQNDEVIKSLTVLDRGTRDINKSIRLQGLVADLARAKNLELAQAANVVAKVFGGQETALRRAVPGLHKHAHGLELIAEAQRRLAGQAAAGTTAAERFQASLHDTQEIIGAALLPSLNRLLEQLSRWMQSSQNQAKLQHAANEVAKTGATVFGDLAFAVSKTAGAYDKLNAAYGHLPGLGKAGILGTLFGGTPPGQILGLLKRLRGPGGDFGGGPVAGGGGEFGSSIEGLGAAIQAMLGGGGRKGRPTSLAGRFNLAELRLAQAQLTKTQADDRRILVTEKGILTQQAAGATKLKEKIALTQQLAGVQAQILAIDQAATDQIKQQNAALKARADAIKSAVLDRLQRRQTNVENQRALRDALAGLRVARQLGGPGGIRLAGQAVADARFNILRARLEAAPATLRGGQFALGNIITINVHGVTDPDKVATAVVAAIKRRERHTTVQSRGPAAGVP